jgi:periplasmic copper chaperone A
MSSWPGARLSVLVCATLVVLAACSAGQGQGIEISAPMARPSPLEGGTGGAFVTVHNGGREADRLRSAASPAAKTVELHETVDDNGVMRMAPQPDGWEIAPGGELVLKPGGRHLMLIDLVRPLEPGAIIEITLNFDRAGPIKVQVPVKAME